MTGSSETPSYRRPGTAGMNSYQAEQLSRPTTSGRPVTARAISSALSRAPSTASRLVSSVAMQRPSSRAGLGTGIGLSTPISVVDRPITQQGLSGMKTGVKGPQRQVQDKSYYLGLLRTKAANITAEMGRLQHEIDSMKQEQSTYLTYDKKVKEAAQELTELQGTLADYNTLLDLTNTDTEQADVLDEIAELKEENDQQMSKLDVIFSQKQDKEERIRQLEHEINEERHAGESMIESLRPELRQRYAELRELNTTLLQQMDAMQQQSDLLESNKKALQDELSVSKVKTEAVELLTKLAELEEKRNEMIAENQTRGTPQQERDKLIAQVKGDNAEIATMERQITEAQEETGRLQEEIHHLDQVLEENQSERGQKFRELKKREETIEQFLKTFEEAKEEELKRISELEENNVEILEKISKDVSYFGHLPSSNEYMTMRSDLNLKKDELRKSQYTETSIKSEHLNLQANLQKIEALEAKVGQEKIDIETKLAKMETEMEEFTDIGGLRKRLELKRIELAEQKDEFELKKDSVSRSIKEITNDINVIKKQLAENDTYNQLQGLEKKWAHLEQSNFILREFVAQKRAESNVGPAKTKALNLMNSYNQELQEIYQSGGNLC